MDSSPLMTRSADRMVRPSCSNENPSYHAGSSNHLICWMGFGNTATSNFVPADDPDPRCSHKAESQKVQTAAG
jgi:hypothetical protein